MEPHHLYPILPGLLISFAFFAGMPIYAVRKRREGYVPHPDLQRRRPSFLATPFMMGYLSWILAPLERALSTQRVPPNAISLAALFACALTGVVAGFGFLATAAWIYVFGGILDMLDGRIARRTGRSSPAGALLDSVLDRWGELLALGGLVFTLRGTTGVVAVLICLGGSQMVSYTRARAEALGATGDGGVMQRAERMVCTVLAMLCGAVGRATGAFDGDTVMAMMLIAIGVGSAGTAVGRLVDGIAALREREEPVADEPADEPTKPADVPPAPIHGLAGPAAPSQRLPRLQPRE